MKTESITTLTEDQSRDQLVEIPIRQLAEKKTDLVDRIDQNLKATIKIREVFFKDEGFEQVKERFFIQTIVEDERRNLVSEFEDIVSSSFIVLRNEPLINYYRKKNFELSVEKFDILHFFKFKSQNLEFLVSNSYLRRKAFSIIPLIKAERLSIPLSRVQIRRYHFGNVFNFENFLSQTLSILSLFKNYEDSLKEEIDKKIEKDFLLIVFEISKNRFGRRLTQKLIENEKISTLRDLIEFYLIGYKKYQKRERDSMRLYLARYEMIEKILSLNTKTRKILDEMNSLKNEALKSVIVDEMKSKTTKKEKSKPLKFL